MVEVSVDDLNELHRVGAVNMPQVAAQYSEMAQALHRTALSDEPAFTRSIGGLGPLHAAWTELRDIAQGEIAVRSYENLVSAGETLTQIAASFATTDYLNGEQIQQHTDYIDELDDRPDYARPPSYIPEPPSPGDPHPEEQPTGYGF